MHQPYISVIPQGPAGPPSVTKTTANFVQPGVGLSTTVAVGNAAWMFQGQLLGMQVGGQYQVAATPGTGAVTVQLTNTGAVGNATAGTTIPIGSILGPTGSNGSSGSPGPAGPSGDAGFSRDTSGDAVIVTPAIIKAASNLSRDSDGNQASWTALTVDTPVTVWTLANGDPSNPIVQPNEVVDLFVTVRMRRDDGSDWGVSERKIVGVTNVSGTLSLRGGAPFSDIDYTPSGLTPTGFVAAIVSAAGPTLAVQVTRPTGIASHAKVYASLERDLPPSPTIVASISPAAGPYTGGTPVEIFGQGFTGASAVSVGGAALVAGWAVLSDTLIVGTTGSGSLGLGNVVVTVGSPYTLSNAWTGLPTSLATITSVTPNSGFLQGGQATQIVGSNFTAASAVLLDGVPPASYSVASDTTINAVAAPGSSVGTGSVSITNAVGTFVGPSTGPTSWTYAPNPPVFGSVSPAYVTVSVGGSIAINGSGFLPATDAGTKIGGTKYSMGGTLSINGPGTQITGTVDPTVIGKGAAYVTIGGVDYAGPTFWSVSASAPSFTIAPTSGVNTGGTSVAISGSHLTGLDIPSVGSVTFSDGTHTVAAASTTYTSDTVAAAVTGADGSNTGTGVCTITTPAGSLTQPWTYSAPPLPTTTSIQPIAKVGNTLTVRGTGFSVSLPVVKFGATPAVTVNVISDTVLTVVVPAITPSATPFSVTVQNTNGTSSGINFYCAPASVNYLWVAHPDYETVGTGIASWVDTSLTYTAVQATGSAQPTDSTAAFSTGAHSLHFNGAQQLIYSAATLPGLASPYTEIAAIKAANQSGLGIFVGSGSGNSWFAINNANLTLSAGSGIAVSWPGGAHEVTGVINSGTSGSIAIDNGTPTTGNSANATFVGGVIFGAFTGSADFFTGDMGMCGLCEGTISTGDAGIVHGINQAVYGTP